MSSFSSLLPTSTNASDAPSSGVQDPSLRTEQSGGGQPEGLTVLGAHGNVEVPILIDHTWEVFKSGDEDKSGEEEEVWQLEVHFQYRGWEYQSWGVLRDTDYPEEQEAKNAFVKYMRKAIVEKHDATRAKHDSVTWDFQELQFELFVMNKPES
jgi:hypothetical protein